MQAVQADACQNLIRISESVRIANSLGVTRQSLVSCYCCHSVANKPQSESWKTTVMLATITWSARDHKQEERVTRSRLAIAIALLLSSFLRARRHWSSPSGSAGVLHISFFSSKSLLLPSREKLVFQSNAVHLCCCKFTLVSSETDFSLNSNSKEEC